MRKILTISSLAFIFVGCATHRDFTRIDLNGTYRVTDVSGEPRSRLVSDDALHPGATITIQQTDADLTFTDGIKRTLLDLDKDELFMKGKSLIYKPYGGAPIVLGPAMSKQYDRVTRRGDELTLESKNFECGLLFFLIPWKEGGTAIVRLEKTELQHSGAP